MSLTGNLDHSGLIHIRITKPIQGGSVRIINSKSAAHRLLICAALSNSETFINCPQRSEDIDATIRCLQALGAIIRLKQGGLFVTPINQQELNKEKLYVLDCGESGATLRFLLPVCGALGIRVSFAMAGRLPNRPLSALYDEMTSHGCKLSEQGLPNLTCEGQLKIGTYTLPGNITSQFISGLMFALPLLCSCENSRHKETGAASFGKTNESLIQVTGVLESRPYVDMTLDALRLFGINVFEEKPQVFRIPGRQTGLFEKPASSKFPANPAKTVFVEGDWSNAAFWLSAGAIGKNPVTCTGLNLDSRQGDRAIVQLLSSFGANVVCENDTVTVSPAKLRGIEIDTGDIPDLVPVLAAVAALAEGKTIIRNASRLRIKESDRLHTVATSLSELGADISETNDGLIISGKQSLAGGETQSFGDHRIVMTAAVLSTACSGPVIIRNAEAVRKSYPGFFEDFSTALGGECDIIK